MNTVNIVIHVTVNTMNAEITNKTSNCAVKMYHTTQIYINIVGYSVKVIGVF